MIFDIPRGMALLVFCFESLQSHSLITALLQGLITLCALDSNGCDFTAPTIICSHYILDGTYNFGIGMEYVNQLIGHTNWRSTRVDHWFRREIFTFPLRTTQVDMKSSNHQINRFIKRFVKEWSF